jgi:hypothetical protein
MRAYKFRSSAQFDCALDIIFNKRLYCADWRLLNDAVEGMFIASFKSSSEFNCKTKIDDIVKQTRKLRVCSLSMTYDSHLLWAHYASGFDGLAIEIDLPEYSPAVRMVKYGGVFGVMEMIDGIDTFEAAEAVLSSKYGDWSYEKEVRILCREEWFAFSNPVRRVIAGHRMKDSLFRALRIICKELNITLNKTSIGDTGIDVDHIDYI